MNEYFIELNINGEVRRFEARRDVVTEAEVSAANLEVVDAVGRALASEAAKFVDMPSEDHDRPDV